MDRKKLEIGNSEDMQESLGLSTKDCFDVQDFVYRLSAANPKIKVAELIAKVWNNNDFNSRMAAYGVFVLGRLAEKAVGASK